MMGSRGQWGCDGCEVLEKAEKPGGRVQEGFDEKLNNDLYGESKQMMCCLGMAWSIPSDGGGES